MRIRNKKLLAVVLTVCLVLTQMVFATSVFAADSKDRLAGADRYSTAIAIAQAGWTTTGSQYAVLARGDDEGGGADALGAAPLAKKYNAPILLTDPAVLSDGVLQELKDLGVKTVFIAGGTGAVSQAIEDLLVKNGMTVTRYFGADRFGTAMDIANKVFADATQVALVYAYNFADALSISSYAAANGMPILLADKNYVPDAEKTYIASKKVVVVGGNGVVGDELFASLKDAVRYGGPDRYATNADVLGKLTFDYSNVFVATGENFPDALAGAAFAALKGNPIVLYSPEANGYAKAAAENVTASTKVYALGGASVVPQAVVDDLNAEVAKKAEAEKAAAVKAAVDAIKALPAEVKLADEEAVVAARALVDEAKAKKAVDADITNLDVLVAAEAKIAALKDLTAAIDKTEVAPVLPGIYVAKLYLKDGVDTTGLSAKAGDVAMTLTTDANGKKLFYAQVATEEVNAVLAKAESLGTVDVPNGKLEGVVESTSMDSILPGINLAKVVLKAGLDTDNYNVVIDGTVMTAGTNADGDKYFYAQVKDASVKAEVINVNAVSVDVTIK